MAKKQKTTRSEEQSNPYVDADIRDEVISFITLPSESQISAQWKPTNLSEHIDVKHGFAFKGEFFSDEETENILLTPTNFRIGGGFNSLKFKYYNGEIPPDYILNAGDLIVTMTDLSKGGDTLGYPAKIPHIEGKRLLHNQRLGLIIFKDNEIFPDFLYWLLRTREYRNEVLATATGSTVKHTSPKRILNFSFRMPPKEVQIQIARTLSAVEQKEELNNQTSKTLEAIGQTLFRRWFIDFEFPDKHGKPYKSNGGKMNDGGAGEIPEGWVYSPLGEHLSLLKDGSHNPPKRIESGIRFIAGASDVKDFHIEFSGCTYISEEEYLKIHKTWLPQEGDVLFTIVGTIGNVAIVQKEDLPFSLQRSIAVLRSKELPPVFLYLLFKSPYFQTEVKKRTNTTAQPGIYLGSLSQIPVIIPESSTVKAFEVAMHSAILQMQINIRESEKLRTLRDALLPRLMSGKIRVQP